MITEFIWDFDGMLFDTYPHTTAALMEYFRRHGKEIDESTAFSKLKVSILGAFRYFGVDKCGQDEFYEIENDLSFAPHGVPYEGIPSILKYITDNGGRNYLYTHRDKVALKYLELYGLKGLFSDFVTKESGFPFKPCPDAINHIINKNSLKKESCLMLGDRPIDCGAGINAGISTLLFDEFSSLKDSEYTYYTVTTGEVFAVIKDLLNNG